MEVQLQDMFKDQLSIKHHFSPIIEEGESLTSILNQNGVPKWQDIKIPYPRAIIDRYQLQEKIQSSLNGLEGEHHKFRSGHWKSALRDIRELDGFDSESTIDSSSPSEEEQVSVEELTHAYKKLDQDYKRFLSECGLSK